jgi:putative peptidoglycan lipid II flippase
MSDERILHHATRMALITGASRVAGYLRNKALAWVLGATAINDAFQVAFAIPNAFRALLAEGALHAAFVPALAKLGDDGEEGRHARDLVGGVVAMLLMVLAIVIALGVAASPILVRLYAWGFEVGGETYRSAVGMNRLMFGYLGFISLAAVCQGVLNSRGRFLLPAATPILLNVSMVAGALALSRGLARPEWLLSAAVLVGGALQFAVQLPAVRALGFSLSPLWRAATSPAVRQVGLLMLPGLTVLGINQLNQVVTLQFASFLPEGSVAVRTYAYRVTELMYGGLVVQMTTVLLPHLSRQLRTDAGRAGETLLDTLVLVWFVTLPSAAFTALLGAPIVGVLFGGGAFDAAAVELTGVTLTAYAFSLLGLAHGKVMASSYFAQQNTRSPMWGSVVVLVAFTGVCLVVVGRYGVPGLGMANTAAMTLYALWLTVGYARRYGFGGARMTPILIGLLRQIGATAAAAAAILLCRPITAGVAETGVDGALRVGGVLATGWLVYLGVLLLLGGREPLRMVRALRGRAA